jgi:hypothetical protein
MVEALHVVATLLLEQIDTRTGSASRLSLIAADPVYEEFPGGFVGVEPFSDVLIFANNFENELKDDFHPLVVGDVQLHCVNESLEIIWNSAVEIGARSVNECLKKTQEWSETVKVLINETSLYCAEQLLELITLFVISVVAMSFRQRPD